MVYPKRLCFIQPWPSLMSNDRYHNKMNAAINANMAAIVASLLSVTAAPR